MISSRLRPRQDRVRFTPEIGGAAFKKDCRALLKTQTNTTNTHKRREGARDLKILKRGNHGFKIVERGNHDSKILERGNHDL